MRRNSFRVDKTTVQIRKIDRDKLNGMRRMREINGLEPIYDVVSRVLRGDRAQMQEQIAQLTEELHMIRQAAYNNIQRVKELEKNQVVFEIGGSKDSQNKS